MGLGAIYPNFREDSPAKIVSGFGGTLNLVLNLLFVLVVVVLQLIPSNHIIHFGNFAFKYYWQYFILSLAGGFILFFACVLPLYIVIFALKGQRYKKREIFMVQMEYYAKIRWLCTYAKNAARVMRSLQGNLEQKKCISGEKNASRFLNAYYFKKA